MVACLRHSAGILVALAPLIVVLLLLHRAPDPWRPSADDALGAGIDLLLLCGLGLVSILALAVALLVRAALERRRRGAIS